VNATVILLKPVADLIMCLLYCTVCVTDCFFSFLFFPFIIFFFVFASVIY
jgi:hypothetical protein